MASDQSAKSIGQNRINLDDNTLGSNDMSVRPEAGPRIPIVESTSQRMSEPHRVSDPHGDSVGRACEIFEKIVQSLLILPNATDPFSSLDDLANAFDSDCRRLKRMRYEWEKLLRSLVRVETSVERREMIDNGLASSASAWSSEILNHLTWPKSVTAAISVDLTGLDFQQSTQILTERVTSTAKSVCTSMAKHLGILQDQAVCGTIEWTSRKECQFSYCTRAINSSQNRSMMESSLVSSERELIFDSERSREFPDEELVTEVWQQSIPGTRRRLLTVHIHDLADAVKSHPLNVTVKIPADQQAILDSVPSWLMEQIEIVEGKLVRERQWCKELGLEKWIETNQVTNMWTELIFRFDPAIVLSGTFVLSGWKLDEPVATPPTNGLSALVKRVSELLA